MAFIPSSADDFATRKASDGSDCAHNMLMWMHNEEANYTRYKPSSRSFPDLGTPGIQPECFQFRERDLARFSGPSSMVAVFSYLTNRLNGRGPGPSVLSKTSTSMIRKGVQVNDFLESRYNHKDRGFLAAEFVPPFLSGLPARTPDFSRATGSMRTDSDAMQERDAAQVPCVTAERIKDQLPKCEFDAQGITELEAVHCRNLYRQAVKDIEEYASKRYWTPASGSNKRYVE
jgi:hypothetical protein